MGILRQAQNPARQTQSEAARLAAQRKMYCVWFVAVIVPFAILFCLFPSPSRNSRGWSRLPASGNGRLVSGDKAFKQQVIVEDSVLNPLEQGKRAKSVVTEAEDRFSDRRPTIQGEREPRDVGRQSGVNVTDGMDTSNSGMEDSASYYRKQQRLDNNVNRKSDLKDLDQLREDSERVPEIEDRIFGDRSTSTGPSKKKNEKDQSFIKVPKPNTRNRASECNISKGNWIADKNGTRYANASCPWIDEEDEKCMNASGFRDARYSQWRWQPAGCALKRFQAKVFLKTMEGKAMAFVGDALARAQARSLLCLLAGVEAPKSNYVSKENQSSSWHFPASNFTLTTVWSPFLVQETEAWISGAPDGVKKVRLDVVEPSWARLLPKLDAVVLSAGSWFRLPVAYVVKNQLVGCHGCGSKSEGKELGLYSAYRAAMRSAILGVTSLPLFTGTAILQQTIMEEPEKCTMSSRSSSGELRKILNLSEKVNVVQKDEYERALKRGIPNGSKLETSETTTLTFQHPAFNSTVGSLTTTASSTGSVDFYCSNARSCLTGPFPTWNQLLLRTLQLHTKDVVLV